MPVSPLVWVEKRESNGHVTDDVTAHTAELYLQLRAIKQR